MGPIYERDNDGSPYFIGSSFSQQGGLAESCSIDFGRFRSRARRGAGLAITLAY